MSSRHDQSGVIGLFTAILLLLVIGLIFVQLQGRTTSLQTSRYDNAQVLMARIQNRLNDFVKVNKRLPCPASPIVDDGIPVPNGATVLPPPACPFPNGTVPWAALGLSAADALDPWARKISYRVATGPKSPTVADGLDRSQCDTVILPPPIPADAYQPDTITGLCKRPVFPATTPRTLASNLSAIPSLTINDMGVNVSGVAYVLISHGETGRGAYLSGGQRQLPLPTPGGAEAANTGTVSFARANANTTVPSDQTIFFDDVLVYELLTDLITKSGLAARNWPD